MKLARARAASRSLKGGMLHGGRRGVPELGNGTAGDGLVGFLIGIEQEMQCMRSVGVESMIWDLVEGEQKS